MRYRASEIKIGPEEFKDREHLTEHLMAALQRKLRRKLRRQIHISDLEIIRESVDARHRPDVKGVYTLDFDSDSRLDLPRGGRESYLPPVPDPAEVSGHPRPVIAGFGPCGIFAALILAEAGLRPLVLERGRAVDQRMADVQRFWTEGVLDPESNVQFGEGGAGTFSDGKLTTGIRDIRIRNVLETFVEAGADPKILYQQRPHIGTDKLQTIIPAIRKSIEKAGGEIRFGARLEGITTSGGKLTGVTYSQAPDGEQVMAADSEKFASPDREQLTVPTEDLILAIGHSARDTFAMLYQSQPAIKMEQKPFSIGVRIEHPQEVIDAAQYGDPALAEVFGPAAYQLHYRCTDGRGVYTFCMCPGGQVINASSEEEGAVTNGMSNSGRDSGVANSGLLVDVRVSDFESDHPLAGIDFQRRYEKLALQQGRAFPGGLPSTDYQAFREHEEDPVRKCLPAFASGSILEAMPHLGRKLAGFDADDARMTAVETRSSSPVRILRDEQMQSGIPGVIPAGEGPGYAGGIMSAAVDGIRAAEQVIRKYMGE